MELAITDAKARLTELVRRAEVGEEVVITRHGHAVARLVALRARSSVEDRAEVISAIRARAAGKVAEGPSAARSQDFLFDDEGLSYEPHSVKPFFPSPFKSISKELLLLSCGALMSFLRKLEFRSYES